MAFWNKEKTKVQPLPEQELAPVETAPPVQAPVQPVPETSAPELKPLPQSPAESVKKVKPAPNRKRPFDAHVWFSEAEQRKLERRVEQSGLSKGVFIRKAALENPIVIDPDKEKLLSAVTKMTAELKYIHAELGRQGGLLKMAIKPNEGQRQAHPEEWNLLVQTNHDLVRTQRMVLKTMEAVNGYFKAHQL